MIIAIPADHPAAPQLRDISRQIRNLRRGAGEGEYSFLANALDLSETVFGANVISYQIEPGIAEEKAAIEAYQYIRRYYPAVLDLLCFMASKKMARATIEVGSLKSGGETAYSSHDLLQIMPRILAQFRGRYTP